MKFKFKHIIATFALAGVMAIGGIAALSARGEAKGSEVAAQDISSGVEIRFNIPSDWGWNRNNVHLHTWTPDGPTTSWPGHTMTKAYKNSNNEDVFSFTVSSNEHLYDKIIFNDGSNQLAEVAAPSVSTGFYWNGSGFGTYNLTSRYYLYDYESTYGSTPNVYAWNNDNNTINNSWPGVSMENMSSLTKNNYLFSIDLDVKYDRVIFNGNGKQTGDLTPTANYVYYTGSPVKWWDNINFALAHNFRENTMLMRTIPTTDESSTAQCSSRYNTAKSAYNALKSSSYWGNSSAGVCHEFAQSGFNDTMTRLQNWATANSETFDPTSGSFTPNNARAFIDPISSVSNTTATVVVIAVTLVSVTAIATYVFMRKRKENQ